jgi:hypothetical protein
VDNGGPDGALWFTQYYSGLGRITTSGAVTEYTVPLGSDGITVGPDGALWFTNLFQSVGRVTTSGDVTQFFLPTNASSSNLITTGTDGSLWFTDVLYGEIWQAVFPTADLSVDPPAGSYHSSIAFTGSAFAPNEGVSIYNRGVGSDVLASATTDANGSFTVAANASEWPYGPRMFRGLGQSSGKLGAVNFSMTPRVILTPGSGIVGTDVSVKGYGFGPLGKVDIYWKDPRIRLRVVFADVNGTFGGTSEIHFKVPADAPTGANGVIGDGKDLGATGRKSFTVE